MATFGDRLRYLRENRDLTQEQLGLLFSVKKAAISKYERNSISPDFATLSKLADYFGVTTDFLLGRETTSHPRLPILGTIRAGIPILAQESYDGYLDVPDSIRADFALRVAGDSMIGAGILEGDLAICQENELPQTGRIIVALNDDGAVSNATLKYYFNNSNDPKLKAANPDYPDINYKQGYRCAGHMVALIRQDAPGWHTYTEYLTVAGYDEWTGVIEMAVSSGIKPNRMQSFIQMINEMK